MTFHGTPYQGKESASGPISPCVMFLIPNADGSGRSLLTGNREVRFEILHEEMVPVTLQ